MLGALRKVLEKEARAWAGREVEEVGWGEGGTRTACLAALTAHWRLPRDPDLEKPHLS